MMAVLVYVVAFIVIAMTLHAGYLGWKFYLDEIIRKK